MTVLQNDSASKIKAIETEYNGYRFRSRLEARWAIFFDEIGLKYNYEQEGYFLGEKYGRYLPDFWFPYLKIHGEIKPAVDQNDLELYRKFRDNISPIILFCGSPWEYRSTWFGWDLCGSGGGGGEFNAALLLLPDTITYSPGILIEDNRVDRSFHMNSMWEPSVRTYGFNEKNMPSNHSEICLQMIKSIHAINRSKQARFEHGETP